ncbi:MAG TPA: ABC transporter substrate-binding protein [Acidimicrobiia bacterium]|nr:ABC transporter substrate-binding protein [Acidimicrobiia bacterium]
MPSTVGMLVAELLPGRNSDWLEVWANCFALALDEARENGALEQPVELVTRAVEGLPTGSQADVVRAWRELEREGVVAVLGPSNADNGMAVRDTANDHRTATILFGCSEQLASEWTFSVPWGSAPEDAYLALHWVARQGRRSVGVLWDSAWHAEEWHAYARLAARRFGVDILGDVRIPAECVGEEAKTRQLEQARRGVERLRRLGPEALVMMTSHGSIPFATAVRDSGWDVPRVVVGGSFGVARRLPELFTGWVGTCLWDDANPMFTRFITCYEQRFGTRPLEDMAIPVYDGCRALLEGLALAPIMTRAGVRTGLERVKLLPATTGGPGSVLSFGPYDHRGYKGPDISILRRQETATTDGCRFEGYYRPEPAPR